MAERSTRRGWLLAIAVAAIGGAVYAVGTSEAPAVAEYDPPQALERDAIPAVAPAPAAGAAARSGSASGDSAPVAAPPASPRAASTRIRPAPGRSPSVPDSAAASPDTQPAARPHRSDNYGGYRGYGGFSRPARPRPTERE